MQRLALKAKIGQKIARSRREVFLRSDFKKLGEYDQVGRALRQLTSDGTLIKVGYGVYAKARPNRITGKPMLAATGGFAQVAAAALNRLGVQWAPSDAVTAYQSGSAQIPANAEVKVLQRFNRKIGTDKFQLQIVSSS